MKKLKLWYCVSGAVVVIFSGLISCKQQPDEKAVAIKPHVYAPEKAESNNATDVVKDSLKKESETAEEPKSAPRKMPTMAELKTTTPGQEAARALSNDAMKAAQMSPEAFGEYMQTRIPYYKGKGNLKAENDMVRIEINGKKMQIETVKGRYTFPM